ncbi:MAG: efflux RND transporter periplasmic adaptor subunit [candidate division Zixibacteria bacterium]
MNTYFRIPIYWAILLFATLPVYGQGPVVVDTEPVKERTFHDRISLVGRTSAKIESKIVSEVSGRVAEINASEGTWVKSSQPLITIDSERLYLTLKAKEAESQQATVQAELAKDQKARAVELKKQNLISDAGFDSAVVWDVIQAANYQRVNSDRLKLKLDYENSVIKAPFDGYTGRRLVDVGEWVTPGLAIFEMVDLSAIKIIVDLPERYFGHLQIGSEVNVTVSNDTETEIMGHVTGISPNASRETHTYPVIIEVDNSTGKLGGGMLVRTILTLNEEFRSLAVPKDAIVRQGNKTIVYTIDDGKATSIPVSITSESGKTLAVESQMLKVGMPVVTRGNERIYPGADVTTGEDQKTEEIRESSE